MTNTKFDVDQFARDHVANFLTEDLIPFTLEDEDGERIFAESHEDCLQMSADELLGEVLEWIEFGHVPMSKRQKWIELKGWLTCYIEMYSHC